ncbi:N-acetyltransferase family protein [Acidisoma sp. 7E03]
MTAPLYRLRPERRADAAFLLRLYAEVRAAEMDAAGWPEAERRVFLREQLRLQSLHYHRTYPEAHFEIVMQGETPVGRLYWHPGDSDIHVIDLSLLRQYRNQGLGSALLREVILRAESQGKAVSLAVLFGNPAIHLYRRLGFKVTDSVETNHLLMRRLPAAAAAGETDQDS